MFCSGGKQPRLAKPFGKIAVHRGCRIGHQPVDGAVIADNVQLAGMVRTVADDLNRRVDQFLERRQLLTVVPRGPHLTGHVIAIDVGPVQLGQPVAVVDNPAGNRACFDMRMGDRGRYDRSGASSPFTMHGLRAFDQTPAVVGPPLYTIDQFPQLPAHITDPKGTRLGIEAHLPRVTEAVRPDLPSRSVELHKGIIAGDRIAPAGIRMVDVDPQDRRKQRRDVLARLPRVRGKRRTAVSGGNVQVTVRSKLQATAVVAARQPTEHQLFAGGIQRGRVGGRDAKTAITECPREDPDRPYKQM